MLCLQVFGPPSGVHHTHYTTIVNLFASSWEIECMDIWDFGIWCISVQWDGWIDG